MPSLRDGDYRLVGAIQGSRPDAWYRQLLDARRPRADDGSLRLSCDCPSWVANQSGDRACKHTRMTARLLSDQTLDDATPVSGAPLTLTTVLAMHPRCTRRKAKG